MKTTAAAAAAGTVEDAIKQANAAAADGGGGCGDGGRRVREVVMVEDYAEFKRSMPLLPMRKPAKVQLVDLDQSKP